MRPGCRATPTRRSCAKPDPVSWSTSWRRGSSTTICACGPNSAVLHYGHAGAPNDRRLETGDLALLDMGAEYHCYCSDLTCTMPVGGKFGPSQRIVYEGVLSAQRAVFAMLKPGVSWTDCHLAAENE